MDGLLEFLNESLRMDMILRNPLNPEMDAVQEFLRLRRRPTADDIEDLGRVFDRSVEVRSKRGMYVRNSSKDDRQAPGGASVVRTLESLLSGADRYGPYLTHLRFTALQPLTAINGIVGRILWLKVWIDEGRPFPRSFLKAWYQDSLEIGHEQKRTRGKAT